ncbi:MAG: nuclear transport factor 2 family protein [Proteobacteria bacterium]|nr:nuclear transport factor 2 family protein [Pseudomonadota bacterium]
MNIVKIIIFTLLTFPVYAEDFNSKQFAVEYFEAWKASQAPDATKKDLEHYLSFLKDDLGHQHLPYSPDDKRYPDGKERMREGMTYYLGAHTEYKVKLLNSSFGFNVIVLEYEIFSKGKRPNGELVEQKYTRLEVLEIEDGKVSVIRIYSE